MISWPKFITCLAITDVHSFLKESDAKVSHISSKEIHNTEQMDNTNNITKGLLQVIGSKISQKMLPYVPSEELPEEKMEIMNTINEIKSNTLPSPKDIKEEQRKKDRILDEIRVENFVMTLEELKTPEGREIVIKKAVEIRSRIERVAGMSFPSRLIERDVEAYFLGVGIYSLSIEDRARLITTLERRNIFEFNGLKCI